MASVSLYSLYLFHAKILKKDHKNMNNGKKYYLKYFLLDKRKVGKNGKNDTVLFYNPYVEISHNCDILIKENKLMTSIFYKIVIYPIYQDKYDGDIIM